MNKFENPVIIEFPLRGEWMDQNTPGKKIPSHGTDQLGQRYAFDFLQINWDWAIFISRKDAKNLYFFSLRLCERFSNLYNS